MTRALGGLRRMLAAAGAAIAEVVAPSLCPICEVESAGSPICRDCREELREAAGLACPRCALPAGPWADLHRGCSECRGRALGFDAALALGPYFGPIRDLCLRLKHQRDAWLARWLAEILADARADEFRAEIARGGAPVIVPVPLHWRRRLERGYNQAEALADALARALGLRTAHPLRRIKDTAILAGAGRTERARRLHGAFHVRAGRIQGRTVFLVDDILTTGATCGAAARALKKAGATRVVAVVIARAETKG